MDALLSVAAVSLGMMRAWQRSSLGKAACRMFRHGQRPILNCSSGIFFSPPTFFLSLRPHTHSLPQQQQLLSLFLDCHSTSSHTYHNLIILHNRQDGLQRRYASPCPSLSLRSSDLCAVSSRPLRAWPSLAIGTPCAARRCRERLASRWLAQFLHARASSSSLACPNRRPLAARDVHAPIFPSGAEGTAAGQTRFKRRRADGAQQSEAGSALVRTCARSLADTQIPMCSSARTPATAADRRLTTRRQHNR